MTSHFRPRDIRNERTILLIGYFVGVFFGARAVIWWTKHYGRVSLKPMVNCSRDLADMGRIKNAGGFSTRRDRVAPEQEAPRHRSQQLC